MPCGGGMFGAPGRVNRVRDGHRRQVLALLQDHGALTRAELVRRSGISRATISEVETAPLPDGFVREIEPTSGARHGKVGRPSAVLTLDPSTGAAVGIDGDPYSPRVCRADLSPPVFAEAGPPHDIDHDADTAMALAAD